LALVNGRSRFAVGAGSPSAPTAMAPITRGNSPFIVVRESSSSYVEANGARFDNLLRRQAARANILHKDFHSKDLPSCPAIHKGTNDEAVKVRRKQITRMIP